MAICLLGALTALPEGSREDVPTLGLIWGTTAGLALAHWFAFRVSARLVGTGRVRANDVASGSAQVAGAGVVAVLATIAVALTPEAAEDEVVALVLAGTIALVGFAVAKGGGASRRRSLVYAGAVLLLAVAVVEIKNRLLGH